MNLLCKSSNGSGHDQAALFCLFIRDERIDSTLRFLSYKGIFKVYVIPSVHLLQGQSLCQFSNILRVSVVYCYV